MFALKTLLYIEALLAIGLLVLVRLLRADARALISQRFILLVMALPAIGYLSPMVALFYLLVLLAIPILSRHRVEAAGLFFLSLPMLPLLITTPMLPGIGPFIPLSACLMMILGLLVAWITRSGEAVARRSALDIFVVLICLVMIAMTARSTSLTNLARVTLQYSLWMLLPYLLLSRSLRTASHVRFVMVCFVSGVILMSIIALFEAIRNWPLYQGMYGELGVQMPSLSLTLRVRGGLLRAPGAFAESTTFAVFLMIGALAIYALRSLFKSRPAHLAATGIAVLGLITTQSRGAWLGFVVGMILLEFYRRKTGRAIAFVVGGALSFSLLALAAISSRRLSEILGFSGDAQGTADYRGDLLRRGLQEAAHSPFIGSPAGVVEARLADLIQGEGIVDFVNSYLMFLLRSGIVGLTIFIGAFLVALGLLWSARPRLLRATASSEPATAVFAALAALSVSLIFTGFSERNPIWLVCLFALTTVVTDRRFAVSAAQPARQRIQHRRVTAIVDIPPAAPVAAVNDGVASG